MFSLAMILLIIDKKRRGVMHKLRNSIQTCLIYVAVVLLAGGYPAAAMAETVDSAPPAPVSAEPVAPTSPASEPQQSTINPEAHDQDNSKGAPNPETGTYDSVVMPLVAEEQQPIVRDTTTGNLQPDSDQPEVTSTVNVDTDAVISNTLHSDATSGNAGVKNNTTGGDATSGNATAVANVMNMINSSVSGDGAEFATFVTDVVGDVHGDIMLYPMLISAMLQAANTSTDSTIAVNHDAQINNNINLNATSGNADVKGNTTAGNATTGTANTVANVMNIINSIIAANQSFVGTINIYGNLDGDILVAPDFIPQLLASNNGGSSAPANSLTVSSQETQSIINNIDLNAVSGNATVANNTNAGNATTGNAATNLVLLNLSGHQIIAKDSLLVFVNVLGQWVGLIVDAPSGASAAALGTGVTTNDVAPDLTIDVNNHSKIVNNLNLNSQSGDATVANNTTAGNATTGNATASANVANIAGSQLGLSGWFGVLFINVFGSWLGSFGVDTERGNIPTVAIGGSGGVAAPPSAQPFQFVVNTARSAAKTTPYVGAASTSDYAYNYDQEVPVLPVQKAQADTEEVKGITAARATASGAAPISQSRQSEPQFDFLPVMAAAFIVGLGVIVTKTILTTLR
jgi:hypothetical protein